VLLLISSEVLNDWLDSEDLLVEFSIQIWLTWLREDLLLEVLNESIVEEQVVIVSNDFKGDSFRTSSDFFLAVVAVIDDTTAVACLGTDVAHESFLAVWCSERAV